VDFTREPIIETVITPKDGCTLVVRSSKNSGQEEYFVDAVEVVTFGNYSFFRSRERPKTFLVPVSDYELLEVRETRLVLKNVGFDRSIKIGGGREASRPSKEASTEKNNNDLELEKSKPAEALPAEPQEKQEERLGKKRERRRNYRKKRDDIQKEPAGSDLLDQEKDLSDKPSLEKNALDDSQPITGVVTSVLSSLLPPPVNLISETLARYKDNALFKGVFFTKEEDSVKDAAEPALSLEKPQEEDLFYEGEISLPTISLDQPKYGSFEVSEAEEEAIYKERQAKRTLPKTDEEHSTEDSIHKPVEATCKENENECQLTSTEDSCSIEEEKPAVESSELPRGPKSETPEDTQIPPAEFGAD